MEFGSWDAAVVASLCDSKRAGSTFDHAWKDATKAYPPRRRDMATPAGGKLFDTDTNEPDESVVDALYRFAHDAWHDRRPALRGFDLESLRDEPGQARLNDGLGKLAA